MTLNLVDTWEWLIVNHIVIFLFNFLQVNQMRHMTKRRRIGMIDLSAEDFSSSCLPHPTAVIKSLSSKLPIVAKKKNDDLLTIIKVSW